MYKILDLLEKVHEDALHKINTNKYKSLSERSELETLYKQSEAAILIIEAFESTNEAKELNK